MKKTPSASSLAAALCLCLTSCHHRVPYRQAVDDYHNATTRAFLLPPP